MTEKDRNTIIIAVVALLIFGIAFLGIRPAFTGIQETKAKNAELSAQKKTMQSEIAALPQYKTNLETAKTNYNATAARVYGDFTNDKIHDAVVAFVSSCGLSTTSFTVNSVELGSVQGYSIADGVGVGGVTDGTVKLANVTINVYGTSANMIKLIDKFNTTEGMYLDTVSFANSAEATSTSITFNMVLSDTFA